MSKKKTAATRRHKKPTDNELVRLPELIDLLSHFIDSIAAWTVPSEGGRRIVSDAGCNYLEAAARRLQQNFFRAQRLLEERHSSLGKTTTRGEGLQEVKATTMSLALGTGACNFTLWFTVRDVRHDVLTKSGRTGTRFRRSPSDPIPFFSTPSPIPSDLVLRLKAALARLVAVEAGDEFDPSEFIPEGMRFSGVRASRARVLSEQEAAERRASRKRPFTMKEIREQLITKVRLLRHLGIDGSSWLADIRRSEYPEPQWRAPAGSGQHSRFVLGTLYDFLVLRSPRKLKPIEPTADLVRLTCPPDAPTPARKARPKSAQKRGRKKRKRSARR